MAPFVAPGAVIRILEQSRCLLASMYASQQIASIRIDIACREMPIMHVDVLQSIPDSKRCV